MSTCIKCNSEEELKMLNFFTFHRSYEAGILDVAALKEFTRREFLKDMDKHFDDFKMELLCADCVNSFEWDFGRAWEHYSEEGIKLTKDKNKYLEGEKEI